MLAIFIVLDAPVLMLVPAVKLGTAPLFFSLLLGFEVQSRRDEENFSITVIFGPLLHISLSSDVRVAVLLGSRYEFSISVGVGCPVVLGRGDGGIYANSAVCGGNVTRERGMFPEDSLLTLQGAMQFVFSIAHALAVARTVASCELLKVLRMTHNDVLKFVGSLVACPHVVDYFNAYVCIIYGLTVMQAACGIPSFGFRCTRQPWGGSKGYQGDI